MEFQSKTIFYLIYRHMATDTDLKVLRNCAPLDYRLLKHKMRFYKQCFFRSRLKCCLTKFKYTKNWPYPEKEVFKMLFRKSETIWKRSWSLVLNIFRDLCFRIGHFRLSDAFKSVAYKKACPLYT